MRGKTNIIYILIGKAVLPQSNCPSGGRTTEAPNTCPYSLASYFPNAKSKRFSRTYIFFNEAAGDLDARYQNTPVPYKPTYTLVILSVTRRKSKLLGPEKPSYKSTT